MTALPALVRQFITLEQSTVLASPIPATLAEGLAQKDYRLIDIVKELNEVLVSDIDAVRSRGVALLSAVVAVTDKEVLDRQSTKTLVTFFVSKLADNPSMMACTTALTVLTEAKFFGVGEGMEVTRGLFEFIKLPSYPQSTRFLVYTLLDSLMSRCRASLKRLGKEFVAGYCALVEGEKDPRNLLLSFSLIKVILLEFEFSDNVEDLFDITFCYFPITFTPPPDDPYGISSEDLVVALRDCLSATPKFGPLALPLYLDKMQAASEKTKRQTLQALTACFPIYGAAVCGEWAGRFSEALSIEVFHATDNDTMELALATAQSLFRTLYPDVSPVEVPKLQTVDEDEEMPMEMTTGVQGIGVKVVQNSLEELKEPDKSNAKPAVRILAALLGASSRLAHYVISLAFPQLLALYKNPDEVSLRSPVLSHLSDLLAAIAPSTLLSHTEGQSPLEPYRDDLLSVLTSGTRSPASATAALEGLVHLIKIPHFLTLTEVTYCVSAINEILLSPDSSDQYELALDGLVVISGLYSRIIEESTLPILFAVLPSSAPAINSAEHTTYKRALISLAALCVHPDLFEILSLRLVARLEGISSDLTPIAGLYAHHLLMTLQAVLREKVEKGNEDLPKYVEKFVPKLFALFILPTLESGGGGGDGRLLMDAGKVITIVLQRVDVGRQGVFEKALERAYQEGSLGELLGEHPRNSGAIPFRPFDRTSSEAQQATVVLYSAAILALRPQVPTSADLSATLVQNLERCLGATNEIQLMAEMQVLSSRINKHSTKVPEFFKSHLPTFWQEQVVDASKPVASRRSALRAWSWIAKGLVTRSDQMGYDATTKILELFQDPLLSRDAAAVLSVIAEDSDRVLSKENFATIRLLYKQRFFAFLLPLLVGGYKSTEGEGQAIYLVALSFVLQHIPRQMALTELPRLLPLLITALDLPDPSLRANVLDTLTGLVKEVSTEMELTISSVVLKVLKGLSHSTSVKLRLSSLVFLGSLPACIPYSTLHPQKTAVLRALGEAVDDKKKEVRKAAVDCRSRWFLYSG